MKEQMQKKQMLVVLLVSLGIFLRFVCMAWGHNFDWASYCIVGEIAARFGNVYAETARYNYGPVFMCIQGMLYELARGGGDYRELLYRVLMVGVLTAADVGIMLFLAEKYSVYKALIFFLNPISIIITGYHNQFDNIAIFLALCTLYFYNEEKHFNRRDIGFVLLFTLCLTLKHILFLIPVFLLMRPNLCFKKKMIYACVPPSIFIASFVPFTINEKGLQGIVNNVFLYRSFNNFPLLHKLLDALSVPTSCWFVLYIFFMSVIAFVTRKYDYEKQMFIYLIAMVAFSSAVANQYLVIPLVALCAFDIGWLRYCYIFYVSIFLTLQGSGLHLKGFVAAHTPEVIGKVADKWISYGYNVAAWILFLTLIYIIYKEILVGGMKESDSES